MKPQNTKVLEYVDTPIVFSYHAFLGIRNTSAGEMAINILNAVGEFACNCKPKHMKNIRITIFQPTMVEEFFTAVQKRLSEKKGTKSMLGKIAGAKHLFLIVIRLINFNRTSAQGINQLSII